MSMPTVKPLPTYSHKECLELFSRLFPLGLAGEDLMGALAPNGWAHGELRFHHHPSLEQAYADYIEGKAWLRAHFQNLPKKTK